MNNRFASGLITALLSVFSSTPSHALFIDFNADQDGNPYSRLGDSFAASEYQGVIINDSDPNTGSTFVNITNPINSAKAIEGYYVNVGAFSGTPTELSLEFTTGVTEVSFDYAKPSAGFLLVDAFDEDNTFLKTFIFDESSNFYNQASFPLRSGNAVIDGVGNIAQLNITPGENQEFIIDNLQFTPVPVPAALPLLISGLLGLGLLSKRKA